jgi:hypothetical protein
MKRGVIYIYWGDSVEEELNRSLQSLSRYHPELPVETIKLDTGASLLDKASMAKQTPFESTLFLDTDTVVMDRLDFGFAKAEKHGLACCINECPWGRRYGDIGGDQIEYNTGVLFFTRASGEVFDEWDKHNRSMDSSIVFIRDGKPCIMPHNDQAGFSQAIESTGYHPFVLPMNWNLRPLWQKTFFGPVKIWHDRSAPPLSLRMWNEDQAHEASIIKYTATPS